MIGRLTTRFIVSDAISASAFVRTYRPFFELWTIWGAFEPVGFTEAGVGGSWQDPKNALVLNLDVARRGYADTHTSTAFGTYESSGWTAAATGSLRARRDWLVQGDYRIDFGFGASRSEASLRVQRDIADGTYVGASVMGFQQQFEFRVADGTVFGAGADGALRLGPRTRLSASLLNYWHRGTSGLPDVDWGQLRGRLQFEWTIGPEPGVRLAGGGTQ